MLQIHHQARCRARVGLDSLRQPARTGVQSSRPAVPARTAVLSGLGGQQCSMGGGRDGTGPGERDGHRRGHRGALVLPLHGGAQRLGPGARHPHDLLRLRGGARRVPRPRALPLRAR